MKRKTLTLRGFLNYDSRLFSGSGPGIFLLASFASPVHNVKLGKVSDLFCLECNLQYHINVRYVVSKLLQKVWKQIVKNWTNRWEVFLTINIASIQYTALSTFGCFARSRASSSSPGISACSRIKTTAVNHPPPSTGPALKSAKFPVTVCTMRVVNKSMCHNCKEKGWFDMLSFE